MTSFMEFMIVCSAVPSGYQLFIMWIASSSSNLGPAAESTSAVLTAEVSAESQTEGSTTLPLQELQITE